MARIEETDSGYVLFIRREGRQSQLFLKWLASYERQGKKISVEMLKVKEEDEEYKIKLKDADAMDYISALQFINNNQ